MHNHVITRDDLPLLLANGVTTMPNMGEAPNAFAGRTRIAVNKGAVPGPHIFTALAVDGDAEYGQLVLKDRTRVGEGKGVSVRVDLGGPRSSNKKQKRNK